MKTDRINELVNLLHRADAVELAQLREKYPEAADDLSVGGVLGAPPAKLKLEVTLVALKSFRPESEKVLSVIKHRLRRSHIWDCLAQMLAVAGGGTAAFTESTAKVGGFIALFGGLAGLAVKFSRKDFAGMDGGLQKIYSDIGESTWKAREAELLLEHYATERTEADAKEITSLIADANGLARRLNEFLRDYA